MKILSLDPSGNFNEGKGQTGWVVIENNTIQTFGVIKAKNYDEKYDYWKAHSQLFKNIDPNIVVMEQYRLYSNKAKNQINSEMETSKLLGYLEMSLHHLKIKYTTQSASQAKTRFNDRILIHKKYIYKDQNGRYYINGINVPGHVIDALRHGLYYLIKEKKNERQGKNTTNQRD